MSPDTQDQARSGMLAGGNWIIDQVKIIDVYPKHEQLANIFDQSQGTGGSPYNVLLDLAKMGAGFPYRVPVWLGRMLWVNISLKIAESITLIQIYCRFHLGPAHPTPM